VVPRDQSRLSYERNVQSHLGLVTELRATTHAKEWPLRARLFRNPRRALENYEDDHVLIHWTGNGTYAERLATSTGETIPPTRRRVRMSGATLTELKYGKIARG
jgi:hypothetical protein